HASNNLQPSSPNGFLLNEKVGLRPLVCFAKCRYYTTVLSFLIYARKGVKDKRRASGGAGPQACVDCSHLSWALTPEGRHQRPAPELFPGPKIARPGNASGTILPSSTASVPATTKYRTPTLGSIGF